MPYDAHGSRRPFAWWGPWHRNGHNNCRYEALLPRLPSVNPLYQYRGSARWRQAVRSRLDQWLMEPFVYPGQVGRLAAKYRALFCTDVRHIRHFKGPVIVDDDDPVFTPERIAQLNRPNVVAVVTTTDQLRRQFLQSGLEKPCHIMPSGVHLSLLDRSAAKDLRRQLRDHDDDIVVGFSVPYLYTDEDFKGESQEASLRSISYLAAVMDKVWEQNPRIRLSLMGVPSRSVCAFARHHPQVRLLGYVPHTKVLNYFANFDIAVYPRLGDFAGRHSIKLVEFMAAGVPVVSTAVAEAFHVTASQGGIVAQDRDSFVDAILRLASSKALAETYGSRGAAYARDYSWDGIAASYESQVLRHYVG